MMFRKMGWMNCEDQILNKQTLLELKANQISAIRVKGFATISECKKLSEAIQSVGYDHYKDTVPPIGRVGITQYEFRDLGDAGKSDYFYTADQLKINQNQIFSQSFNPLARLIQLLNHAHSGNVKVAKDVGYGEYYAGLVRQINQSALIHADFAAFDAPDWNIGRVSSQLSWNLFVETPEIGGECIVYNQPWLLAHERHREPGSYGYSSEFLKNRESHVIQPIRGDLVLFNSRNFHSVNACEGNRITMSSFIGQMPDQSLVLWS